MLALAAQASPVVQYPGAIQTYFNVSSLQALADDFSTIIPDFIAANENFTIDWYAPRGFLYDVRMSGMRFEKLEIKKKEIKIVPGDKYPSLNMEVSDIEIAARVTGGVFMGAMHMFNFTEIKVEGLKLKLQLGVETDKNNASFWQIHGASEIDFKNLHIGTDSVVFNAAIDVFHQVLIMYLKADEKVYKSAFKKVVEEFNIMLRTRASILLLVPHSNHHLFNPTITYTPQLDAETQIAEVAIDGTIYDTYLKTSHVELATAKANRVAEYPGS